MKQIVYTKAITGPTLFQDIEDMEKPPWKLLHDQILQPKNEQVTKIIEKYKEDGKKIKQKKQAQKRHEMLSLKQKMSSLNLNLKSLKMKAMSSAPSHKHSSCMSPGRKSVHIPQHKASAFRFSLKNEAVPEKIDEVRESREGLLSPENSKGQLKAPGKEETFAVGKGRRVSISSGMAPGESIWGNLSKVTALKKDF